MKTSEWVNDFEGVIEDHIIGSTVRKIEILEGGMRMHFEKDGHLVIQEFEDV